MELRTLRKKIDRVDSEILRLMNERMELALRTARFKETVADEKREREILEHVHQCSHRLISREFFSQMFSEIILESKKLQESGIKLIGFQGEHGAYGELASRMYSDDLVPIPCTEFRDVFEGVKNGWIDLGIVPAENSLEGAVTEVIDLLIQKDLTIVGEVTFPVSHCLLAPQGTEFKEIKVVYSHPQALAQCRQFIAEHGLEPRPYYDTAGAAKMLSLFRPPGTGAIADALCAPLYHLEVLEEKIEDTDPNVTRFVVISKYPSSEGGNKSSVVFSTEHVAGALCGVLQLFSEANVNLTRIESRPIKDTPGTYVFVLDFHGSDRDEKIQSILKNIEKRTVMVKFLGCYRGR